MDGISQSQFESEYPTLSSTWEYVPRECDRLLKHVQNDTAVSAEKQGPLMNRLLRDLDSIGGKAQKDGGAPAVTIWETVTRWINVVQGWDYLDELASKEAIDKAIEEGIEEQRAAEFGLFPCVPQYVNATACRLGSF